jgi:hypothetical protein
MAERTGCPVLLSLWSYVTSEDLIEYMAPIYQNWPTRDFVLNMQTGCPILRNFRSRYRNWFLGSQKRIFSWSLFDKRSPLERSIEHVDLRRLLP